MILNIEDDTLDKAKNQLRKGFDKLELFAIMKHCKIANWHESDSDYKDRLYESAFLDFFMSGELIQKEIKKRMITDDISGIDRNKPNPIEEIINLWSGKIVKLDKDLSTILLEKEPEKEEGKPKPKPQKTLACITIIISV